MPYRVINVNRKEYVDSIAGIEDVRSRGFADQAMRWWDRHYSWNAGGSVILTDEVGRHLCYLFYKIDCYGEYLTIHNILTPLCYRRHGYAFLLLQWVFELAVHDRVRRFKAVCVPQSLDFYLTLGFCYWGLTPTKDYYCNLPVPRSGLGGVRAMVEGASAETLAGKELQCICDRVIDNDTGLDSTQQGIHDTGLEKLKDAYMQTELMACMEEQKRREDENGAET